MSAARYHRRATRRDPRAAPQLAVAGEALRWSRVARMSKYVLMRAVRGEATEYQLVDGVSYTPPPVPGVTVSYRVRTGARGSAWSPERSIAYARASAPTHSSGRESHHGGPDPQAAPEVTVSGYTLSWSQVAGVTTYVLATTVPGQATSYSEITGTSTTPPAVPGATVGYSVRTAVEGSAWSPQVSISYPATTPKPPPAPPPTTPPPGGGGFEMGVVVGSAAVWELPWVTTLGAHTARIGFSIGTPVSQVEPVVAAYAAAGIKPLLLATFDSRMPTTAEARNLGSWAAAFGPNGTFWRTHSAQAGAAVTDIEFGNETSLTYQYQDNSPAGYTARAEEYALRFRDAETAMHESNPSVGLLAQADDGGQGTEWIGGMFAAVPDLGSRVAGWITHQYSPEWQVKMDKIISETAAHGASSSIPIYVTEGGLASDNGRCLSDNYGWNRCMTYSEAATTLSSVLGAMRARYGSRLRAYYLFQARDQAATGTSTDREYYFGALQNDSSPKGAYTTLVQSLLAANP